MTRHRTRYGLAIALAIAGALPMSAQISRAAQTACSEPANLGYRVQTFSDGMQASVWYPTRSAEAIFRYSTRFGTRLALNAPVSDCARFPLVVFSHGFGGCATQSIFFTETLARAGYIVVAPDHADAACEGTRARAEIPFFRPEEWSDASYTDRRDDVRLALDEMLAGATFGAAIDGAKIAGVGHSLGGYTMLGLAGGWATWLDQRLQAVLLFSPYAMPFDAAGTIPNVHRPVMYQGGTLDFPITPAVEASIYPASNAPKYFVEFEGAGHLAWTNASCAGFATVAGCVTGSPAAQAIVAYGIGFLERHLRGTAAPLLDGEGTPAVVHGYQAVP